MKGYITDEKSIQMDNEWCFPSNNSDLTFDSMTIFEMVNLEDFNNLIVGIEELYKNIESFEKTRIDKLIELIKNNNSSIPGWNSNLPLISTKEKPMPMSVYYDDLGNHVDFYKLKITGFLSSYLIIKIEANLKESVSKELNNILYKYHEEEVKTYDNQEHLEIILPVERVKEKEIQEFKNKIKCDIISFFKDYFNGYFFRSSDNIELIPSIDTILTPFPSSNENDLKSWVDKNHGFFHVFGLNMDFCKNDAMLLSSSRYGNSVIFVNNEIGEKFFNKLWYCSFNLLVVSRWLEIQNKNVSEFNTLITHEMSNIKKDDLNKIICNRKGIYHKIFDFERFKSEFNLSRDYRECNFISIKKKSDVFKKLSKDVNFQIQKIDLMIKTFDKHSNSILELTNIDYMKKTQEKVNKLTNVIIALTIIQVVFAGISIYLIIFNI